MISYPGARFRVCLGDDAPWGKLNLNIISICGGKDATWQRHQQQRELSAVFQTRTHRMVQGAAAGCFCFYIALVCVKLPGACGKSTAELQFYYICCVPLLLQLTNGSCDEISSGVARVPSSLSLSRWFCARSIPFLLPVT
jgi:hypothetical protein